MKSTLALLAFFAVAATAFRIEHECPPFWTRLQGNCYRFFGAAKTWDNAEAHCQTFFMQTTQGHLVSLHSEEESDFVFELWQSSLVKSSQVTCRYNRNVQTPANAILIGYNDKETENTFVWTDGSPNNYNGFLPNQPSDAGNEDCVDFLVNTSLGGQREWNDIPCSWSTDLPYVCKMKATTDYGVISTIIQSGAAGGQYLP